MVILFFYYIKKASSVGQLRHEDSLTGVIGWTGEPPTPDKRDLCPHHVLLMPTSCASHILQDRNRNVKCY